MEMTGDVRMVKGLARRRRSQAETRTRENLKKLKKRQIYALELMRE